MRALSSLFLAECVTQPPGVSTPPARPAEPSGLILEKGRASLRGGALCFSPIAQIPFHPILTFQPAQSIAVECAHRPQPEIRNRQKTGQPSLAGERLHECLNGQDRAVLRQLGRIVVKILHHNSRCLSIRE